jgi:hypothetical protein
MKLTLTKKAREIARLHRDILASLKMTVEKAIRIGELLVQAKAELKHGQWLPWLRNNVPFKTATAYKYESCYEHRDTIRKILLNRNLGLQDAYALIEHINYVQKQLPAPEVSKQLPAPATPIGKNGESKKKRRLTGKAAIEAGKRNFKPGSFGRQIWEAKERGEPIPTITDPTADEKQKVAVSISRKMEKLTRGLTVRDPIKALLKKCDESNGHVRVVLGLYNILIRRFEECDYGPNKHGL